MAARSWFYSTLYVVLRDGKYDEALNNVERYRVVQSPAGFRRVYDKIVGVLDEIARGQRREGDQRRLLANLMRLDILVEYQKNRRVLYTDLADGIRAALREIMSSIKANNWEEAKKRAEALRMALDAVLAYKIVAERRREEEEEFL